MPDINSRWVVVLTTANPRTGVAATTAYGPFESKEKCQEWDGVDDPYITEVRFLKLEEP